VNGPLFVLGWITGLAVAGGAILLFGGDAIGSNGDPSTASLVVKSVLGALLLGLGLKQWRDRPSPDEEPAAPGWMESIDQFTAVKAFGIAVLLSGLNPKNLALDAAGMVVILESGVEGAGMWIAFGVFVALASVSVIVPVVYYLIAGERADDTLDSMKSWLIRNNTAVMGVLLLIFGVKLLSDGVQGLVG
jgi:hypothetical protein